MKQARQGDVLFIRIADDRSVPDGAKHVADRVIARSNTGHHHVASAGEVFSTDDPFTSYLRTDGAVISHLKAGGHAPIALPAGTYIVRRPREHTPEGIRMTQD